MKKFLAMLCVIALLTVMLTACGGSGEVSGEGESSLPVSDASGVESSGGESSDPASSATESSNPASSSSPASSTSPSSGETSIEPAQEDKQLPQINASVDKIMDTPAIAMAADSKNLYYVSAADSHIYRCDLNGANAQKISDDAVSWLRIREDGRIEYTTNKVDGMTSNYFSIKTDGSDKQDNHQMILDIFPSDIVAPSGKVYYKMTEFESPDGKNGIYVKNSASADNSTGTIVYEGNIINSFCLVGDYIVLSIMRSNGQFSIIRVDLDGKNESKVFDASGIYLSTNGEDVYFVNSSDGRCIYKANSQAIKG